MDQVKIDQTLGRRKRGDDAKTRFSKRDDDYEKTAPVRTADARHALFSFDRLGPHVEWIVFNNLFGLFGRHLMAGDVVAIGSIPLKIQIGTQAIL